MEHSKKMLDKQREMGDIDAARLKTRSEILQHGTEHPEIKKYRIGMLDEIEIQRLRRMQQTQLDDQRRKMDHAIKDLQHQRGEFVRIKNSLIEVAAENDRQEKEREREKQAREKQDFGDMSMGKG